jgi:hypothetical protein
MQSFAAMSRAARFESSQDDSMCSYTNSSAAIPLRGGRKPVARQAIASFSVLSSFRI